ncbi:hypothetical protein M885DRAFT_189274 [Pelagophyceae sp. CCMP2097]|nr:hypothetical protein M885DRAFT_189274 [Pelagophyceae sp. CCMP2097]
MRCLALVSVAAALRGPARGGGRSAGRHRGRAAADASALALRSVGQNIEDHALECAVSEDVYYGGVRSSAGGASGRADAWRAYAFPGAGYPGGVDASPAVPFGANDLARVSEEPLFTADEARAVIDEAAAAQAWRSDALGADFATRSSCSYAAVLDLPKTLGWLNSRALPRLVEAMHSAYPEALKDSALRLKLSRLVKYDALNGATPELGMHRDGPLITATVALNGLDEYEGGGTVVEALSWDPSRPTADLATARSFERDAALRLARGHVLLYPGFIRHGGGAITSGVRYILVMFFVDKNVVDHDRHCIGRAKHLVDDALGIDGAAGRCCSARWRNASRPSSAVRTPRARRRTRTSASRCSSSGRSTPRWTRWRTPCVLRPTRGRKGARLGAAGAAIGARAGDAGARVRGARRRRRRGPRGDGGERGRRRIGGRAQQPRRPPRRRGPPRRRRRGL